MLRGEFRGRIPIRSRIRFEGFKDKLFWGRELDWGRIISISFSFSLFLDLFMYYGSRDYRSVLYCTICTIGASSIHIPMSMSI